MGNVGEQIAALVTAVIGVAILAVLVSGGAQTSSVLNAFFSGLSSLIATATSPITGRASTAAATPMAGSTGVPLASGSANALNAGINPLAMLGGGGGGGGFNPLGMLGGGGGGGFNPLGMLGGVTGSIGIGGSSGGGIAGFGQLALGLV